MYWATFGKYFPGTFCDLRHSLLPLPTFLFHGTPDKGCFLLTLQIALGLTGGTGVMRGSTKLLQVYCFSIILLLLMEFGTAVFVIANKVK